MILDVVLSKTGGFVPIQQAAKPPVIVVGKTYIPPLLSGDMARIRAEFQKMSLSGVFVEKNR